ncbi:hypothetical protein PFISCL1PPCAC_1966, partial [Pristionchus fissidentatus]
EMSSSSLKDEAKDELGPLHPLEAKKVKNLDEFITFGWYTVMILVVAEFLCLSTLSNMVYMVFSGANPTVTGCGNVKFDEADDGCKRMYQMRNETGCEPTLKYQFYSVNVEFNYLCHESKVIKNSISLQMTAVLIGAFVFGQCSDLFGRRLVLLVGLFGSAVFSAATSHSHSLFMFNLLRVLAGFFTGGVSAVQGVYLVENIPRKHRMLINTIITWSPNFIIYPIIAYFCYTWRMLSYASAVINLIGVAAIFFCHESPRFLIQQGKIEEARKILSSIRRRNRDSCEIRASEIEEMLIHEQEQYDTIHMKTKKHTFIDIFNTWQMCKWTLTLSFGLIVTSLVNYGILFNMEKLSGSLYLNNIFFGIIRWAMNISVGVLDYFIEKMGRKILNSFAEIFNITCLLLISIIYFYNLSHEYASLIRIAAISATAMCAQVYIAKFMTATELYPTSVRNLGASALSISSRIGTILGPLLFYLSDYHASSPYISLSLLVLIDFIAFSYFLPETKGMLLENHLPAKKNKRKMSIIDRRTSVVE